MDLPEKITIFLVVSSFSVEGRPSARCEDGSIALGAMAVCEDKKRGMEWSTGMRECEGMTARTRKGECGRYERKEGYQN